MNIFKIIDYKFIALQVLTLAFLVSFQNCGVGFDLADDFSDKATSLSSNEDLPEDEFVGVPAKDPVKIVPEVIQVEASSFKDTEYGPTQIKKSICPRLPTSYPKSYVVNTKSEFDNALKQVKAGEAIVISGGNKGNWSTAITASGSKTNPIYIVAQKLHATKFYSTQWKLAGQNIVVAGFDHGTVTGTLYQLLSTSNNIRIACMKADGGPPGISSSGGARYHIVWSQVDLNGKGGTCANSCRGLEIDNNIFTNIHSGFFRTAQGRHRADFPREFHIHHNLFTGDRPEDHLLYYGLAWNPEHASSPEDITYDDINSIFENNQIENWAGSTGRNLFDIKASRNIFRNNCFEKSKMINIRAGNNNLMTGNWIRSSVGSSSSLRMIGLNNQASFNYFAGGNGAVANILYAGVDDKRDNYSTLWQYFPAKGHKISNNVWNDYSEFIGSLDLACLARSGPPLPSPYRWPNSNDISENKIHSLKYLRDYKGGRASAGEGGVGYCDPSVAKAWLNPHLRTASHFLSDNPKFKKPLLVKSIIPDAACGTPGVVNGLGKQTTALPNLLGNPKYIHAPSWW